MEDLGQSTRLGDRQLGHSSKKQVKIAEGETGKSKDIINSGMTV